MKLPLVCPTGKTIYAVESIMLNIDTLIRSARCLVLLYLLLAIFPPQGAFAHHPHDPIDSFAVTPEFPEDPTVFVSSIDSMRVFLKSSDRGETWRPANSGVLGRGVLAVETASDWKTSKTVYIVSGGGGLQRSTDGGRTWGRPMSLSYATLMALPPRVGVEGQLIYFGNDRNASRLRVGDKERHQMYATNGETRIVAIATSSEKGKDANIALSLENKRLALSFDHGTTWSHVRLPGIPHHVAFSPNFSKDETMYVATHGAGVLRSIDKGKTFTEITKGLSDRDVNHVVVATGEAGEPHLFAATKTAGLFKSINGGETWELTSLRVLKTDQTNNHYRRITLSPRYPADPTVYCSAFEGLHVSHDGGKTWVESNIKPTRMVRRLGISPNYKVDRKVFAARYGDPLLVSSDGGDTWAHSITNLPTIGSYAFAVSPTFGNDQSVYLGLNGSVLRVQVRDSIWKKSRLSPAPGLDNARYYQVYGFAFSPEFEKDRTMYAISKGGLSRSVDAGTNWTTSGVPTTVASAVALSPTFEKDGTMFVGGADLHRSADGGESWSAPLAKWNVHDIVPAPDMARTGEVYAILRHRGFFRSADAGRSWSQIRGALEGFTPTSLQLSPVFRKDRTMYVSTSTGGLFVSRDRGVTWQRLTPLGSAVDSANDFVLSPDFSNDQTMFVGTFDGVWRSRDAGASWKQVTHSEFYDNLREPWIKSGRGWRSHAPAKRHLHDVSSSRTAGDRMRLGFSGLGVQLLGLKGPDQGLAEIYIDGELREVIDAYAKKVSSQEVLFEDMRLQPGRHTIEVRVLGKRHEASTNDWVSIDGAEVFYRKAGT